MLNGCGERLPVDEPHPKARPAPTPNASVLFGNRLAELAAEKQQLLAQGEIHRAMIDLRLAAARDSIPFLGTAGKLVESHRSWWPFAAAGAGLVLAWRGKGVTRLLKSGLALLPLVKRWLA